ncbi:indolepyruvate ferredoxin oxidoreductase alpha subunit [Desulfocicer vacuolatum DSM 3385]|uniref:Indolepyruvate oxidoreductase subunit IorA n=1 Tax=Desulfocicer vacuolatum DSM 3385 TaxID=1121400 RepID=A0A1W2AK05_9BACT|nr:thiamine pyrophosphate-dependent enzyme [Desulfocicer vacuolatum]SMC60997.1 indolepyruvate ferredoxin oxidoreductase alpha subunit [Desulfocicer vacuolatum DSM 3385]
MTQTDSKQLMLGNQALARGLVENGCRMATAYPGTPSSEILTSVAAWKKQEALDDMHVQWGINEKVSFEIAYAGSIAGLRCAVAMKQVGLNVASDPFMSAAYLGVKGGFLIISADDPGPHSSQTEQDSRLYAMSAKVPVLDPDSPEQARKMAKLGFELSEAFEIPVMIRPTTRVCHARQDVSLLPITAREKSAEFEKNPGRWAATPKFRYILHNQLEEKLKKIAAWEDTAPVCLNPSVQSDKAVVVAGVSAAHARDIIKELDLWDTVRLYQVFQPFPLHTAFVEQILSDHSDILVLEETTGVIEMQLARRDRVQGKKSGAVPETGELLPEIMEGIIAGFLSVEPKSAIMESKPGRRPTLCAGCPHRASFFAIKRAAPKGIYTSDIGCYTLGMNLGAVDTVLCMGAAISQAAGFAHAYTDDKRPPIVATMGDSTFFHSGVPALIDAVVQKAPFLLVILDNRTTAMTGNQPTPATGRGIMGEETVSVDIEKLVTGCGIDYCITADPMDYPNFLDHMKAAVAHARENGPAVLISRSPCVLSLSKETRKAQFQKVVVNDNCDGCGYCVSHFECPALVMDENAELVHIDTTLCTGCGVCVNVCPKKSIEIKISEV